MTLQLTRAQTHAALLTAGWASSQLDVVTAIAAAESSLEPGVSGPVNTDGTVDYGLLQINSRYVTGAPYYSKASLLSDPVYNAKAGLAIFHAQGLGAWAAYDTGRYLQFMPPGLGGPALAEGSGAWFLVADLQTALNQAGASPVLVSDGSFGPLTLAALQAYQKAHPVEPNVVGPVYWKALAL